MTYKNKTELLSILNQFDLKTKKSLGQNFLINPQVIDTIINNGRISSHDTVIEIGPGLGILTQELLKKAGKVCSIELDQTLIPYLTKAFSNCRNFQLINQNALEYPVPNFNYKLIANIPYYITSPLLSHFLNNKTGKRPSKIILLVQLEVAEKICSKIGNHSILSLQTQIFGQPKIIGKVSSVSFYPSPKVDSAIIQIDTFNQPKITNLETFGKLIKAAFGQKRKTLLNSIQKCTTLSKSDLEIKLHELKIDPKIRPQQLSIEQWDLLASLQ
jgi:16S rRNA (adenine1518-N6/adenine1519-N6)-dimethyltransferase